MSSEATPAPQRSVFSSRLAFVLAGAASAVGLGNLWRFPSQVAQYGGGAYVLTYLLLVLTFGFSVMVTEITIGRKTGKSALEAFADLGKQYKFIGVLASLVPMIITPYYCVIGGWILKYTFTYMTGGAAAAATGADFFNGFVGTTVEPLGWTFAFILICMFIVALGVQNGIEKLNSVLMPALFFLMIALSIYSLVTMPGAIEGLKYYLVPKPEDFGLRTLVAASGQLFFSLSLSMGIMITYGSYLPKKTDIETSAHRIELFDTAAAILAGFLIIPPVFALMGAEGAQQAGVGLMFMTMPGVFAQMPLPAIVGFSFFLLVSFAAATSAISLSETIASIFHDSFKIKRKTATLWTLIFLLVVAIFPTLGFSVWGDFALTIGETSMEILSLMDFVSNSVMMPIVAFLTVILAGWLVGPKVIKDEIELEGNKFKAYKFYVVMVKWVSPMLLIAVLLSMVLATFGIVL